MSQAPVETPWAAIGLLVLGVVLFYAAARSGTGVRTRGTRLLSRVLLLLSGATLAASVVLAMLS